MMEQPNPYRTKSGRILTQSGSMLSWKKPSAVTMWTSWLAVRVVPAWGLLPRWLCRSAFTLGLIWRSSGWLPWRRRP